MATSQNSVNAINQLLNPVLFQVIGSTPASIRDNIRGANVQGNTEVGNCLVTIAIFAAAVNKATMQTFLLRDELAKVRPIIKNAFTVSGEANMTALTLLGHCLFTTELIEVVPFAMEFRKKMGQKHLWDGDLSSGSLSEKQSKILKEKKRLTSLDDAKLLGDGFLKYMAINSKAWTVAEASWWDISIPRTSTTTAKAPQSVAKTPPRTTAGSRPGTSDSKTTPQQADSQSAVRRRSITLADGAVVSVREDIADYYMTVNRDDGTLLARSLESRGVQGFEDAYGKAMELDPEMRGTGGSRVG